METVAAVLAVVALAAALAARRRAASAERAAEEARASARERAQRAAGELGERLAVLQELVAKLAAGEDVDAAQVRQGRLWQEVTPDRAASMVASGEVHVLDVRSPAETAQGIIPGAMLVPIDELEHRHAELPDDGRGILVYCAVGGRSAAACEFLSQQGRGGLLNLRGGIMAWSGPKAAP